MSNSYRMSASEHEYDYEYEHSSKPKLVGYYSVDEDSNFAEDLSQLRYLIRGPGRAYLDLTIGESQARLRHPKSPLKAPFIQYITEHKDVLEGVGFVTSHGSLRTILQLPYNYKSVEICACLFDGVIYLREVTPKQNEDRRSRWGHKFEQYVLSSDPSEEPNIFEPVKEMTQFKCIFKTTIKEHCILYGAELDGVMPDGDILPVNIDKETAIGKLEQKTFVEVKTSFHQTSNRIFKTYKSRQIWIQCFYTSVNKILIGFRDENGIVNEIKEYQIGDMLDSGKNHWKPQIMLNFTNEFLAYVKNCFKSFIENSANKNDNCGIKLTFRKEQCTEFIYNHNLPQTETDYNNWNPLWFNNQKNS